MKPKHGRVSENEAHRQHDDERAPLQLNLTAMIDVVFLLLVYFVLSVAFSRGEGVLTTTLEQMHVRRGGYLPADTRIVIAPTNAVRWQHVVNAFNAAVRAKYTDIAFAQATQ